MILDVGQSVTIGDKHFEVVYLGSLMTPMHDVSLEIPRRIQTANRCFFGLRKHMRPSHLSRQTKFTIHKILIHPVLRYGNQLLVFERKVLRMICGPKIENGVCRRRYIPELDKEFNSPNALNVTKTSRLHAGHMIRRPEDLPQKAIFRAKPNGRRNQGRPESRWADVVNSDSLELWGQRLDAQDRQTWKYLLQQALTRYWL
jgi:hypothetical protein